MSSSPPTKKRRCSTDTTGTETSYIWDSDNVVYPPWTPINVDKVIDGYYAQLCPNSTGLVQNDETRPPSVYYNFNLSSNNLAETEQVSSALCIRDNLQSYECESNDEVLVSRDREHCDEYQAEQECLDFLWGRIAADNVFLLLSQAKLFEKKNVERRCFEEIDLNTVEVLNEEAFNEIDIDTLCEVLSRDTLRINELHLFQAIVRWSEAKCKQRGIAPNAENKRESLGRALNLIRYPLMKMYEISLHVEPTKLLPDSETIKIFKYLALPPCNRPTIIYSDKPRSCTSSKELSVSRYKITKTSWGCHDRTEKIKFTVDKRIFVVGLGLYGSLQEPHEYKVKIKIANSRNSHTLAEHDTSFVSDGTPKPFPVLFKEPVEIYAGTSYIASADFTNGPDVFYGDDGLRKIFHQESGVTFTFTTVPLCCTTMKEGQIPEILFYPA